MEHDVRYEHNGVPVGILLMRFQNPVNLPDSKLFLVERKNGADELNNVVTVADLQNFGTTPPSSVGDSPFYRVDEVLYRTDFPDELTEVLAVTRRRTQALIDTLKSLDFTPSGTIFVFQ